MPMKDDAHIGEKQKERSALLEEASRIVAAASARGRGLTADEDSHVLALMSRVRILEEEIHRLTKHRGDPQSSNPG
jgi:hypothetical protein